MKKILLILFISFMSQLAFSQASGLYIVREVYTTGNYPNDTLIVTSPIGTTVGYSLNPNRDQVLSQVLNSIIALGYRVIPMGDFNMDFDYGNTSAFRRERVMFLAAP